MTARAWLLAACIACAADPARAQDGAAPPAADAAAAAPTRFDPQHTRFGFQLRTRWGQRVTGAFDRYGGEVSTLEDGRKRVRIALETGSVRVADSERWSAMARGPRFFDAERFPRIEFVSDPFAPDLLRTGGVLRGLLTLHGARRIETFMLEPAACARPGFDCDVAGTGTVSRTAYGLDDWAFALSDRVRFTLRVRVREDAAP